MILLYVVFILSCVLLIIGLAQLIVWGGTALLCLISDAADMCHSIFGGRKK